MADTLQVSLVLKNNRASYKSAGLSNNDRNKAAAKSDTAGSNESFSNKALALANEAEGMAKTGKDKNKVLEAFKKALEKANDIKEPNPAGEYFLKNGTIRQISFRMIKAGLNNDEINALLNEVNIMLPE
jgi:hypothetical protein